MAAKIKVYGNSIDLNNARNILSDKNCYEYVNTENMSSSELSRTIRKNDVVVGETGATGGVGNINTNGAIRLGGIDRYATRDKIQAWENAGCATCKEDPEPSYWPSYPPAPAHIYKDFNKYTYFFGLDKIQIQHKAFNTTCCLVTPEIYVDQLNQDEYIQLKAGCVTSDTSSVEFYIIDGAVEVPILPIDETTVFNEKIFFGIKPRFSVDYNSPVAIKKDGIATTISLDSATHLNDALYTVSYTPIDPYKYRPLNSSIKVKTILRLYDKDANVPYIERIRVMKYGRNALWS